MTDLTSMPILHKQVSIISIKQLQRTIYEQRLSIAG